jgi:tetratricopeptide (TPR) repeat protein
VVPSPFLSKDEYVFQQICREVLSHEPDIGSCEIYGTRGQGQRGVDLLASRRIDSKIEVGQCKRRTVLTAAHVRAASKKFFEHWEYWKSQSVRRFILIAACDISSRKLQDAIARQKQVFRKKRITFEAWGVNDLNGKLLPFRQIVQNFYGPDIADVICGPVAETPALRAVRQWTSHHLGVILTELETERIAQLEALREKSREGRFGDALAGVESIKAASSWSAFTPQLKARFLRFEAVLRLNLNEPASVASALVAQARSLDSEADFQVIDAYTAYRSGSAAEALALLSAPRSIDAWNLRWGLLIEGGRASETTIEISHLPPGLSKNADTHRLLTILALFEGDIFRAQAEIAQAKSLGPKHRSVRVAAAMVDYFSCIAMEVGERVHLNWPTPVNWAFVRQDADSSTRLCRAADEFARLAADAGEHDDERSQMETWQLACLACESSRRNDALALAQRLLATNPAHYRVVAWAIERDFEFDRRAVSSALAQALGLAKPPNPDACLALCGVLVADGRTEEAEASLDGAQAAFTSSGSIDVWNAQKAQFLAHRGKTTDALALVDTIGDRAIRDSARNAVLRVSARSESDFRELADQFERDYRSTGSTHSLFKCCDIRCRVNGWRFIAEHAVELVTRVGTDAALRLGLQGAFFNADYELCLRLISEHSALFHAGLLSPEVRALRAECQKRLGHWQDAIAEAEALYREHPSVQRFADLFRLLVETADVPRCALAARELLGLAEADPSLLLQAAKITRLHDQDLAKELWRRAVKEPFKDLNLMTAALGLAYELGIEGEAAAIQRRLFAEAQKGEGPMQVKAIEEIRTILSEQRAEHERLNRIYNESSAPIHLVAHQMGAPLAELYHAMLDRNRASINLVAAPALLARYGGRKMPGSFPADSIYADVTGILLAADLGVLEQIESTLGVLHIAGDLTSSLLEQFDRITPHQPSQHDWREELLRLVKSGQVHVTIAPDSPPQIERSAVDQVGEEWAAQWQAAAAADGVLLAEHPLLTGDLNLRPVSLPEAVAVRVFNLREFLKAVLLAGGLTGQEWQDAIAPGKMLASQPERPESELCWPVGRFVAVTGSLFAVLAAKGWLPKAAGCFRLAISPDALAKAEEEEAAYARREELAAWTKSLLERVQRGILRKQYRVLPEAAPLDAKGRELGRDGIALGTLLYALGESKTGVLWCDDRMVNRHLTVGSRPIVGIVEVLLMLRAKGALSEEEYYEKLLHLRRGNVRYLPLTTDEIIHHLRQARVTDGLLVETPALATLRRYTNACLLDRERLLAPQPSDGNRRDIREWDFVLQIRRAADEALRKIWEQQSDGIDIRRAQADWVWRSVNVEVLGIRQTLITKRQPGEERELTAFSVGTMFTLGILLPRSIAGASAATVAPRKAYYDWLVERILLPLERSNPGFIELVAKIIRDDVTATVRTALRAKQRQERLGACAAMQQLVWNLPNDLLQKLDLPADVLSGLGLTAHGPSISVEGGEFDLVAFWAAQADAVNGRSAHVADRTGKRGLTFVREDLPKGIALRISDSASVEVKIWRDSAYPLLVDDVAKRIAYLESHPDWFDCSERARREAIQRIANAGKPSDRSNLVHEWINESPAVKYRRLAEAIHSQDGIGAKELRLPSWTRLRQHLRLDIEQMAEPQGELAAVAEILLREEGAFVALGRFICLPILLPRCLSQAWEALSPVEAAKVWSQLKLRAPSPLATLHLIRLGLLRTEIEAASIKPLLDELFAPITTKDLFESFHAVLVWVSSDFIRWREGRALSAWQRLVMIWYHACRLHALFCAGHVDLGKLCEWLDEQTSAWNESVLAHDAEFAEDIVHPTEATAGCLGINGLINAVSDLGESRLQGLGIVDVWKKLTVENSEQATRLQLDLVRRTDLARDNLGALLRTARRRDAELVFGPEMSNGIYAGNSDDDIAGWVNAIRDDPYGSTSWIMLQASIRDLAPPLGCRESLKEVLAHFSFAEFIKRDSVRGCIALVFSAGQARHLQDAALAAHIENQILMAARASNVETGEPKPHRAFWLLQALLPLSLIAGDEMATAENFFGRLEKLVRTQPAFARLLVQALSHWAVNLPFPQQRAFWPLLLTVRALN